MRNRLRSLIVSAALLALSAPAFAQAQNLVTAGTPLSTLAQIPIAATAAVNVAAVLTIPAPTGNLYNYVCYLGAELSSDATGGALTNVASTSTNFNAFAMTISRPATANIDSGVLQAVSGMAPATGCIKSTAPGTATTFTSPTGATHVAWTWYATYFQAP